MRISLLAGLVLLSGSGCAIFERQPGAATAVSVEQDVSIAAPVVVYKTKRDYSRQVPISLSADKSRIISYPDPGDLRRADGSFNYPTSLRNGYLLDNRGIGLNTAFLKLTYAEYAALEERPAMEDLKGWILDAEPMLELYRCEHLQRTERLPAELNRMIGAKELDALCTGGAG